MSCFEQSTFLQNAGVMNQDLLIQACKELKWKAEMRNGELWVSQTGQLAMMVGEPMLRLIGNTVIWNRYYQHEGQQKADALRSTYLKLEAEMRVEYARTGILEAFRKAGFSYVEDIRFRPDEKQKHRFFMKGRSKLPQETEPAASNQFTILSDGTVQTSSDYIPEDIHILADKAMEELEAAFGNRRSIEPKNIPAKYCSKAFCHRKDVIELRQGKK